MLELEGVPYAQGADLVGRIWQVLHEKSYALDAAIEHKIKVAKEFQTLAENGDTERTAKADAEVQPIRAAAFQEVRQMLRFHLLVCIDRTGAATSGDTFTL